MPLRRPALALLAAALVLVGCACGSDGPSRDEQGRRTQAIEMLTTAGLSKDQAGCMVDQLGAEAVVEAADVAVLADGEPYQQAAAKCLK